MSTKGGIDFIRIQRSLDRSTSNFRLRFRSQKTITIAIALWVLISVVLVGILAYLFVIPGPRHLYRVGLTPSLLAAFLIFVLLLRLRPDIQPVIIIIAAAFLPFSIATGTMSRVVDSLVLSILFVGVWILKMIVIDRRISVRKSTVNLPIFVFMLVVLISLVWSILFRDPLVVIWKTFPMVQIASATVMIMLPATFLLVANQIDQEKVLKMMVVIMLIAGALGLIKHFGSIELPVNTDGLFSMWVVSLSVSLALFHRQMSTILRVILLALAGAWMVWGFGLNISWLAGWLPGMVALIVLALMRSRILLLLIVLVLILIGLTNPAYFLDAIALETQRSLNTRIDAWEANWRVTGEHLLLGTGPGGYAAYYMSYFPTEATATHNNYVDIIAQTGIVGLVVLLWFFLALARFGYRLHKRVRGRGNFIEAMVNATFAATIGIIVIMGFGDWVFPFAYTQGVSGYDHAIYSWLFMGTILVLDRLAKKDQHPLLTSTPN